MAFFGLNSLVLAKVDLGIGCQGLSSTFVSGLSPGESMKINWFLMLPFEASGFDDWLSCIKLSSFVNASAASLVSF